MTQTVKHKHRRL